MNDRSWWGRLRYADSPQSLAVVLLCSYKRGCSELAGYPQMSASSGPKDYMKNGIYALLQAPGVDEVYLVRGRGPMFPIIRKGALLFDAENVRVLLDQAGI
jgi:hypothetical protein